MLRRCGLDASGSGQEPVAGCCEYGTGFHKRRGISWPAEWLPASEEGLCSM